MNLTSKKVLRAYRNTLEKKESKLPSDVDLSTDEELPRANIWESKKYPLKFSFPVQDDPFKDFYGGDGIINQLYTQHATSDWLTGFYLASHIIPVATFGSFTSCIDSFHTGSSSQFIDGFRYFFKTIPPYNGKNIKWNHVATHTKKLLKPNVNLTSGIMRNGDATNENNLRGWFNQFELNDFDMVMCDIKGANGLAAGINMAANLLKSDGIFILRVSDFSSRSVQIMRFASLAWKEVGIWRSPWGGRVYLLGRNRKKPLIKIQKRALLKMIKSDAALVEKSDLPPDWLKKIKDGKWNTVTPDELLEIMG